MLAINDYIFRKNASSISLDDLTKFADVNAVDTTLQMPFGSYRWNINGNDATIYAVKNGQIFDSIKVSEITENVFTHTEAIGEAELYYDSVFAFSRWNVQTTNGRYRDFNFNLFPDEITHIYLKYQYLSIIDLSSKTKLTYMYARESSPVSVQLDTINPNMATVSIHTCNVTFWDWNFTPNFWKIYNYAGTCNFGDLSVLTSLTNFDSYKGYSSSWDLSGATGLYYFAARSLGIKDVGNSFDTLPLLEVFSLEDTNLSNNGDFSLDFSNCPLLNNFKARSSVNRLRPQDITTSLKNINYTKTNPGNAHHQLLFDRIALLDTLNGSYIYSLSYPPDLTTASALTMIANGWSIIGV